MEFLFVQLDYIYFFSCLSFILAGVAALILRRTRPGEADWGTLSLFWFFQSANKLSLLVSAFLYHSEAVYYLGLTFLAGSFLFLLAFSQRTAKKSGTEFFFSRFYYFLVLSAVLGVLLSGRDAEMLIRYFFGIPSVLIASYVLWNLNSSRPASLKYLSIVFAAFFVVQGLVVPDSENIKFFVLNESLFLTLFGTPIQLVRALLAIASAWLTLNYCQKTIEDNSRERGHPYPAKVWGFYRSLAVFVVILLIGWFATEHFGQRQKRLIENRAASDAKLVVDLLSESMQTADCAVKAMAGSPWIGPLLEKMTGPRNDEANSVLDRYNSSFGLSVCYLMDDKGVVIAASNRKQPDSFMGRDFSFRPYFKNAIAGEPSSYLAVGIVSGKRGYYSSAPVLSEGRPAGVVTAKKDIEELEAVLNPSSAVLLVDSDGIIFLSDEKDLIFRPLWPIESFAAGSKVKDLQYRHVLTEPVLEKRPSSGDLTEFRGSPVLVNSSAASVPGWMLYTLYPAGSIQASRATAMLITAACAVLAMGLLYFINDRELRLLETMLDKEQLAITLQSVGDGLITTDHSGRISIANESALRMLGLRLEEARGRLIEDVMKIVEESSRNPIENPVLEVLRTRDQVKLKNHALLISADGREFNISDSASPIVIKASGVFLGVVLVFRDVSQRIQDENRLRLAAQEWEKTFDNMAEGITVQNSEYMITNANSMACRLLGIKKEDLLGRKCYEVFHKTDSPLASCPMARSLSSKRPEEAEVFEKSLGKWFRISTTPVFDASGRIEKVIHIMQDITERKIAEEKLREYAELQKTVISNLQGVIFSLDRNGVFTLSDGKGLSSLGLEPGQVVGRSVFDVYKDVPEIAEGVRAAIGGHPWAGIVRVQKIVFDTFVSPVFGSDGMVEGVTGIATDITDRITSEELIIELNEQQKTILDAAV